MIAQHMVLDTNFGARRLRSDTIDVLDKANLHAG